MEARYQLRQSPANADGWPVRNLTDPTFEGWDRRIAFAYVSDQ
jgi:hypothetical protein